jgi:hypothetical protein
VVTWCDQHRARVNGIPTAGETAKTDLVLFLDGKVVPMTFAPFNGAGDMGANPPQQPIQGNGLIAENGPWSF